jgi:hypothetical protein
MNYLAHARHLLDDPYALAGSALPDWLRILDRKNRFRAHALPAVDDDDPRARAILMGLAAHFDDDAWFHVHPAFTSLLEDTTLRLRARAPGVRASVLAHILIEMLLDAELMRRDPSALDRYVDALTRIDVRVLTDLAARHLPRAPTRLPELVAYFAKNPFMAGYDSDDGVFARLSGLSTRVGLGDLPRVLIDEIGPARVRVAALADPLLGLDRA